jgi:hypothetical protein
MTCAFVMSSCGMIYIPNFMKNCGGVQVILRFRIRSSGGCNVGIGVGRYL